MLRIPVKESGRQTAPIGRIWDKTILPLTAALFKSKLKSCRRRAERPVLAGRNRFFGAQGRSRPSGRKIKVLGTKK
jgi:hypothetical protein